MSAQRAAVYGHGVDEGFARIEHVQHLPAEQAETVLDFRGLERMPVPVVWCHGLPGPVVLRIGDVRVLDVASPQRVHHEVSHPWWAPRQEVLLRSAHSAGDKPYLARRQHDRSPDDIAWPLAQDRDRMSRRATSFAKPASALLVGDYLGLHPYRWPNTDRDIDEGFARVEHLRLLDAEAATAVFADPDWHSPTVVASVHGLNGVLLLHSSDEVPVLAFVNPERWQWERRSCWQTSPTHLFRGSREATAAEVSAAAQVDAARRPRVDEAELYPSEFDDTFTRRLMLESVHGFRSVPLAALPWPHHQADCPLGELAEHYQDRLPDAHAAHAAAALSPAGQRIQATCAYHQADWPRLVRLLQETLASTADEIPDVRAHPEFAQLSPDDQKWLDALASDPIEHDDGDHALTNGQHRLCALRFAGVQHCPVRGNYLPDTDYGTASTADTDARAEITASWHRLAAEHGWPAWFATAARFLPPTWRAHLLARNAR